MSQGSSIVSLGITAQMEDEILVLHSAEPQKKILSDQRKSKVSFSRLSYLNQVKGATKMTIFHRDGFLIVQSCRLD